MKRTLRALGAIAVSGAVIAGGTSPAFAVVPGNTSGPGISAPAPVTPKPPAGLQPISNGRGLDAAENQAMSAAASAARKSGKPVAVDAATTETQQIVAQPTGKFTASVNPEPVRTKAGASWAPVNTALHRNADGTLSPAATAYGTVSLSGGGSGPLASTTSGGVTYSVSWPSALPAPTVSGSTATYANVLAGVDLRVAANAEGGFSDVLVVKTAAAAKNPALTSLRFSAHVSGGAVTTTQAGINVRARSAKLALQAGPPTMWDSNTALTANNPKAATRTKTNAPIAADPSDAQHPGLAARTAVVSAHADNTSLTITPDQHLLTAQSTVFPVYIDPSFQWHPVTGGTPAFDEVKAGAPCNHVPYFNDAGGDADNGYLGVGDNAWYSCFGPQRAYYQWALPAAIGGASIGLATVNATKYYSANCSATTTVDLHAAGTIGSGTSWNNQPGPNGLITSLAFGPAKNTTYCPNNAVVTHGFVVTGAIQQQAASYASLFTVELSDDGGEAAHDSAGFSRFLDNPTLQITYNHPPSTPTDLNEVTAGSSSPCTTPQPPYLGASTVTDPPVLTATVGDPDGDLLQATFQYWVDGSSTVHTVPSADGLPSGRAGVPLDQNFLSGLTDGQQVDWRVDVTDGQATSAWSAECKFIAEPNPPLKPMISSADGKYPSGDSQGSQSTAAGTAGKFVIATPSPGVTSVVYRLDQPPATSAPPASEVQNVTGVGGVATNPAGHWTLNALSGSSLADSSAGNHPATITGGATVTPDTARQGGVLQVNGTTGYAATSGPVLDTTGSFSVSAWVNLASTQDSQTIVAQGGDQIGDLALEYSPTFGGWAFIMKNQDNAVYGLSQYSYAHSNPATSPVGAWTHLVGTYDTSSHAMTLYVNGVQAGTATDTTPWTTTSPLAIGAAVNSAGASNFANAKISDIQVYSQVLNAGQVDSIDNATTVPITPTWAGIHHLYAYARDAAGDRSETYDYLFVAGSTKPQQYNTLADAMNDIAITSDSATTADDVNGVTGADGADTFSADALKAAGWQPGGRVTIDGATFTLPDFGTGQPDNVLADNQVITGSDPVLSTYNSTVVPGSTSADSLLFLATATDTPSESVMIPGDTVAPAVPTGAPVASTGCFDSTDPAAMCPAEGFVDYGAGNAPSFDLTVPDWDDGPPSLAAVTLPYQNTPTGRDTGLNPRIFLFSVPLSPGQTINSVQLPDVGMQTGSGIQALHVFAMATRNTTTGTAEANGSTVPAPSNQSWTGAWAGPTEGAYNVEGGTNYANQTFRIAVKPSVSGSTVRVKLDNALGTNPLTIGHATIATGSGTSWPPSPKPAGSPVNLTFGGASSIIIPEGGMAYSDPLPFSVTANQTLLVSLDLANSVPYLVEHSLTTSAYEFITAIGAGDRTTDTTGSPFAGSGTREGTSTDILTDLDVTTSGTPTQAVLGDNLIDAWQPNTSPNTGNAQRMSDQLAVAGPTTPQPFATIAEGIEGNELGGDTTVAETDTATDAETYAGSTYGGPPALARIDRDILDQPGLSDVIIDEGLEDVLFGHSAVQVVNDVASLRYYLDTYNVNSTFVGITPCDGYGGDGATINDPCTAAVDSVRTDVNSAEFGSSLAVGPEGLLKHYFLDSDAALGAPGPSTGETGLDAAADTSDHVNLTNAGHGSLLDSYLTPAAAWLTDGTSDLGDRSNYASPYWPSADPASGGGYDASTTGSTSWVTDATHGAALQLDGSTGAATTSGPVLDTTGSYTVSAWADLTSTGHDADIVSQDGNVNSGFVLGYDASANRWTFGSSSADATGATTVAARSGSAPATGAWTHLVGSYNAGTHTLSLYVNGTLAGTATDNNTYAAPGSFAIGRGQSGGNPVAYFPGEVSQIRAFNYPLGPDQIAGLR